MNRCPGNEQEWKIREKELNCQSLHQSNDSKTKLLYHCVLNAEGTELIEVCAPSKRIRGSKCTEFNDGGSIIQESYISCKKFQVPCPIRYNSTEAYKYQECYDIVEKKREKRKNRTENYDIVVNEREKGKKGTENDDYKCSCNGMIGLAIAGTVFATLILSYIFKKIYEKFFLPFCHHCRQNF